MTPERICTQAVNTLKVVVRGYCIWRVEIIGTTLLTMFIILYIYIYIIILRNRSCTGDLIHDVVRCIRALHDVMWGGQPLAGLLTNLESRYVLGCSVV